MKWQKEPPTVEFTFTNTAGDRNLLDEWPYIMPPHRIRTYWREPGRLDNVARRVALFTIPEPEEGEGDATG